MLFLPKDSRYLCQSSSKWLIRCVRLTMCYASKVGKIIYKVDTNLEMPKWYHKFLWWNFEFRARYDAVQNSWVFIVFGTVTPSVRERWGCPKNHLQKYVPNVAYFRKFCKIWVFMVVLCFSYYEESVDVAFLLVVCILTKLLMIKVNQVGDPETYLEQVLEKGTISVSIQRWVFGRSQVSITWRLNADWLLTRPWHDNHAGNGVTGVSCFWCCHRS